MKKVLMVAPVLLGFILPVIGWAADPCPPEVVEARTALKSAQAALKKSPPAKNQAAKSQEIQAPRAQAGARSQDIQSPRSQDIQSPRSQDIQSPRSQDIQSPRSQDIQSPRSQAMKPRVDKANALVRQAEAACKKGDMAQASKSAKEAIGLLK